MHWKTKDSMVYSECPHTSPQGRQGHVWKLQDDVNSLKSPRQQRVHVTEEEEEDTCAAAWRRREPLRRDKSQMSFLQPEPKKRQESNIWKTFTAPRYRWLGSMRLKHQRKEKGWTSESINSERLKNTFLSQCVLPGVTAEEWHIEMYVIQCFIIFIRQLNKC